MTLIATALFLFVPFVVMVAVEVLYDRRKPARVRHPRCVTVTLAK
jgi:hypothetical protein